jgi:hypothetical protein
VQYRQKKLPALRSDAEAEAFVANAGLTVCDLLDLVPMRFELRARTGRSTCACRKSF